MNFYITSESSKSDCFFGINCQIHVIGSFTEISPSPMHIASTDKALIDLLLINGASAHNRYIARNTDEAKQSFEST